MKFGQNVPRLSMRKRVWGSFDYSKYFPFYELSIYEDPQISYSPTSK